jgi:hypothetical protein
MAVLVAFAGGGHHALKNISKKDNITYHNGYIIT